jgi:hypothetical protein
MMHPEVSMMNSRERRKEMLAAAGRQRLARQVRAEARAARRERQHTSVLEAPDPAVRNQVVAAHMRRMETQLAATQAVVSSLRSLLERPPAGRGMPSRGQDNQGRGHLRPGTCG